MKYTPNPFPPIAELSDSGVLALQPGNADGAIACSSVSGSLGDEEIVCSDLGGGNNSVIRTYEGVKSLGSSSSARRRLGVATDSTSLSSRQLASVFDQANEFVCVKSKINLNDDAVILNYQNCQISNSEITVGGSQITVGPESVIAYTDAPGNIKLVLPVPNQDFLTLYAGNNCSTGVTLDGHSNLYIHANELKEGCNIDAPGSNMPAILTVDFNFERNATCGDGNTLTLKEGTISIMTHDGIPITITYGEPYENIIIRMSECDDVVVVERTFFSCKSIEILGGGGSDHITLGSGTTGFESEIFANIIVNGGNGDSDKLVIIDFSDLDKTEEVRPRQISGLHAISFTEPNKTIDYNKINILELDLSEGSNNLRVVSTAAGSETYIDTGKMADTVLIENTEGNLNLNTLAGNDYITVLNTQGDLNISSGADDDFIEMYGMSDGDTAVILGGSGDDKLYLDGSGNNASKLLNYFDGGLIRWHGGLGSDLITVTLTSTGNTNFDLFGDTLGPNYLKVFCVDFACYLLSRENFLANIHDMDDPNSSIERINIDREKNEEDELGATVSIQSVFVRLNAGENKMFFDDTFATASI